MARLRFALLGVCLVTSALACGGGGPCTRCGADGGGGGGGGGDGGNEPPDDRLAWPNDSSQATSDPWLVGNHDRIEVMRPRIMALNFVNAKSNADMEADIGNIFAAVEEATRFHGYDDPDAQPFLEPQLAYAIDLRDEPVAGDWPYRNSTLYPREEPVEDYWGFDYEALFSEEFAEHYGIEDPDQPGTYLTLCELSERGLVHEVWIYGDADVPDVGAAEILGISPHYDDGGNRLDQPMNRCAGNGCFDAEDVIPPECTRTLRIGWVNNTRGVGCYLESIGHGIEGIANQQVTPYFGRHFRELAGFTLDERYGLPLQSWYDCPYDQPCLSYPTQSSVTYNTGTQSGSIGDYDPICGNAHFPPNGTRHYDISSDGEVQSSCKNYRTTTDGSDERLPVGRALWDPYVALAPDCTGAFAVWWWQNFPGPGNQAIGDDGQPMKNWWVFYYY